MANIKSIYDDPALLVDTKNYPYGKFDFEQFNQVQSALIDVFERDENVLVASNTSSGKAQPLDSLVLTPFGFVEMGSLQIGQEVIGSSGKPVEIRGVFPQGEKKVYKVIFNDDSAVECCEEHLWQVSKNRTSWEVRPLKDILADFGGEKWYVPCIEINSGNNLVCSRTSRIFDDVAHFEESFSEEYSERFLRASIEERLGILREIMDCFGVPFRKRPAQFTTSCHAFAKFVRDLVRSLGGCTTIRDGCTIERDQDGKAIDFKKVFRISVNLWFIRVFNSELKHLNQAVFYREPQKFIVDIKEVGIKKCQCISVDSEDGLYVTNDYVLTHNTVCAEMYLSHEIRKRGNKAMFVVPLRSLAQEKIEDWTDPNHHFNDINVSVCTGDYQITPNRLKELEESDLIVISSEMLASCTRNIESKKNSWLKQVGTVFVDESHLLTVPGRGDHLEVAMMKLSKSNKKLRIGFLSATLPNVEEVGRWLSVLNGKDTNVLVSNYRPCPLNIHYKPYETYGSYDGNEEAKCDEAINLILEHPNDRFLVFAHTKRTGELMKEMLLSRGIKTEFHNANLDKKKRIAIEKDFKDPNGKRVIVATSTMAWGTNTPARRVVILGIHRGSDVVPNYDHSQMCVCEESRILTTGVSGCLYVKAKDVVLGQELIGFNGCDIVKGKVSKIFQRETFLKRISFSHGVELCVSNHPILMEDNSWKISDDLKVGDVALIAPISFGVSSTYSPQDFIKDFLGISSLSNFEEFFYNLGKTLVSLANEDQNGNNRVGSVGNLNISSIMLLPEKHRCDFIVGMFAAIGRYCEDDKVSFFTKCRDSAIQIKDLLLSLRIWSLVDFNGEDGFSVVISTRNYLDIIGNQQGVDWKAHSLLPSTVVKIEDIGFGRVCNFTVDDCNTYIVEDVITHNCGRSGRPKYDPAGDAYVLVPSKNFKDHVQRLKEPTIITSQLLNKDNENGNYKTFAFHIISEIHHGVISSKKEMKEWYNRSFAYHQALDLDDEIIGSVIDSLKKTGALKEVDGKLQTTNIGAIASMFYFSPYDVSNLRRNFKSLFEAKKQNDDFYTAICLANIDSLRNGIVNRLEKEEIVYFSNKSLQTFGKEVPESAVKAAYCYWLLLNGKSNSVLNNTMRTLQADFGRTSQVLQMIDVMSCKWNKIEFLKRLTNRIIYGVPDYMVELCELPHIGSVKARKLWAAGFKTLKEVKDNLMAVKGVLKLNDKHLDDIKEKLK